MIFFRSVCRAKIMYRGFSNCVAVLNVWSYFITKNTHIDPTSENSCSYNDCFPMLAALIIYWFRLTQYRASATALWIIQSQVPSQDFSPSNCNRCSCQNQFMASVDDHEFVILAKIQQRVVRHTKIKVSFLHVGSRILSCVQGNQNFALRYYFWYIVLDGLVISMFLLCFY